MRLSTLGGYDTTYIAKI